MFLIFCQSFLENPIFDRFKPAESSRNPRRQWKNGESGRREVGASTLLKFLEFNPQKFNSLLGDKMSKYLIEVF